MNTAARVCRPDPERGIPVHLASAERTLRDEEIEAGL